ncbi:molecular chaperone DjiA [Pontivivens insulae]|uniref:DnaJ-like protein DjlA n=1 Tax=Pontivivens insulae TaxID=1639689 RepID=A0A2R8ADJ5_9RHOB|nr:molecular chaperone DjiA [Pontivivens insulae]RED14246.1 DnaJ like chaperone protein [Pontivivens insulae]SPF30321.1 DnaJ-like protein DjlA [Pontivivens insulae]
MSIWSRITDALSALRQGEGLSAVFQRLNTPPERSVAFTIAVIALGAKMAKADGVVTRDEVTAFREVFHIAPADEAKAARVFNLARQDSAGYEAYAQRVAGMFGDDRNVLEDLLDGLFHIAVADGVYHPNEDRFLEHTAELFGVGERCFKAIRTRHVPDARPDPYDVLGVTPEMEIDEMRKRWRLLVRETHPDRMIARGVPEEAVKLATKRLTAINNAWDEILTERAAA